MAVRILIVDDHVDSGQMAARILRADFHQCELHCDYEEALEAILTGRYDVIVTDLMLPGGNGGDFPGIAAVAGIPIYAVATTGLADTATREGCIKAGFRRILVKPISLNELAEVVRDAERLINASQREQWELIHNPFRA